MTASIYIYIKKLKHYIWGTNEQDYYSQMGYTSII